MQIDTAIEQRRNEIGNVSNDINGERDQNENMRNNLKRNQLDVLGKKLLKNKDIFTINKMQTFSKRYDEIATGTFPAETAEDQVRAQLSELNSRNTAIEAVVNRLRGEDPMLDKMLVGMVQW